MTTKKQINRLFDHVLERNDCLVRCGDYLVVKPVRHTVRAIWLLGTSRADRSHWYWSIGHTFQRETSAQGFWQEQFFAPRPLPMNWSAPDMPAAFNKAVEDDILPMLGRADTIEKTVSFREAKRPGYDRIFADPIVKIRMGAVFGHFTEARNAIAYVREHNWSATDYWNKWEFQAVMDDLGPLIEAGDHAAVADMLRTWETATIQRLGLASIYETTPFPLELQPLADHA